MSRSKNLRVNQVYTACRNCVFATWDNKVQTGCELDRIEKYRKAGIPIHEVYDNEDNEFYLIDGRFCLYYRTPDIMEKFPREKWVKIALEQTKIPYHAILFYREDDTVEQLQKCIDKLPYSARILTVINTTYLSYMQDPDKYTKPSSILEVLKGSGAKQYFLRNVYDEELDDFDNIDLAFDTTKEIPYSLYFVFDVSRGVDKDYMNKVFAYILDEMKQFAVILPDDENDIHEMVVASIAHRKHSGNSFGVHLVRKIRKYEDGGENFIIPCRSIKSK